RSRMTSSIPISSPEQALRIAKIRQMTPDKNAPLAVFLTSDAAKAASGQVYGTRYNEIYLFSSPKAVRFVHRSGGWTPQTIAEHALPALETPFTPLDRIGDVFRRDPV
ncbi:MAG: 3-hydroxyacyl-CoA dehydrogenase, partial [Acetobacteraceae bacterium]|nr:3-hydroxyacyl-CoA dehydrogenase [Acetobacteraceae bacterium]